MTLEIKKTQNLKSHISTLLKSVCILFCHFPIYIQKLDKFTSKIELYYAIYIVF